MLLKAYFSLATAKKCYRALRGKWLSRYSHAEVMVGAVALSHQTDSLGRYQNLHQFYLVNFFVRKLLMILTLIQIIK